MAYVRVRVRSPPVWGRSREGDNYYIGNPIRPCGHGHTGQYGLAFSFSLLLGPSL